MKPETLPRTRHKNQIDWTAFFKTVTAGDVITIECQNKSHAYSIRTTAAKAARNLGIPHRTRTTGSSVRITILSSEPNVKPMNGTLRQAIYAAQAAENNLPNRILKAREKAATWRKLIFESETSAATNHAIAIAAAWKMTADRLSQQLRQRTALHP